MSVSYLETQDLVKKFKRRTVVKNVSLNISQGEVVGLLGPNGAGKTTTFYMIVGMIRPNNGRVFLDRKDITSLPMYKRARYGIATWHKNHLFSANFQLKITLWQFCNCKS